MKFCCIFYRLASLWSTNNKIRFTSTNNKTSGRHNCKLKILILQLDSFNKLYSQTSAHRHHPLDSQYVYTSPKQISSCTVCSPPHQCIFNLSKADTSYPHTIPYMGETFPQQAFEKFRFKTQNFLNGGYPGDLFIDLFVDLVAHTLTLYCPLYQFTTQVCHQNGELKCRIYHWAT